VIAAAIVGGLYVALCLGLGFYRPRRKYAGRHRSVFDAITDFTSRDAQTVRWLADLNNEEKDEYRS
jgi:hypothetical protein